MSELGHITLTRGQFARLAAEHAKAMTAQTEAELPRAKELGDRIKVLSAEAKEKNILVDDATIAENPEAARLRKCMDEIVPEFQELAERHLARIQNNKAALELLQQAEKDGSDISIPVSAALNMLGISPNDPIPA